MLLNAILSRVLMIPPVTILGWLLLLVFITGMAGSLAVPLVVQLLDSTKAARARQRSAVPRQAQERIAILSRRVLEAHDRETTLRKENSELRRLLAAGTNFSRSHIAEAQTFLKGGI